MKHLYRPKLKDLTKLSREPSISRPTKQRRKIKFAWKKLVKPLGFVVLILLIAIFLPPQIEKIKARKEEARRLAEEQKKAALLLEIKSQATTPQEFFNLGLNFLKKGETESAELSFKEAVSLEPYFRDAHLYLAYTYFKTNQLHLAETTIRRAIELDPTFPYSHLLLAEILKNQGRKEEAKASLKRAEVLSRNQQVGGE